MMEAITAIRVAHERPEALPAAPRRESLAACARSGAGGFFTRDRYPRPELVISLGGFGLEESYGRFLKEKTYAAVEPDVRGSLVDLYV